ncbi:MAG: class I SAM-dependent methyltransferase [Thermoleophilia bacterium]|nr:class I SAM-dependent methyltransferase [Thermoleophilia bacterium]
MLVPIVVASAPTHGDADLVLDLVADDGRRLECAVTMRIAVLPSADEQFAQLEQRHGFCLPMAAIVEARRSIGRRDGLLRHAAEANDLPQRAPNESRLAELVRERRPRTVVEFGSGASTILLAELMSDQGSDSHVISVQQDEAQAARTREALAGAGLDQNASVVHVPVGAVGEVAPRGYVLSEQSASALRAHPPELVYVDGPTRESGASRLGVVDLIAPFVKDDAILLLNGAFRDAELAVAAAWSERRDITIHGYCATDTGVLEATLHPSR